MQRATRAKLGCLGVWAAGLIGLGFCSSARADFIVSSSRYADGADDVIVFSALNTGTNGQTGTTKLQSEAITMTSNGTPLIFSFADLDGDGTNDANIEGAGVNFPTASTTQANMPTGSFMRIGGTSLSLGQYTVASSTPQAFSMNYVTGNPTTAYTNITSVHIEGSIPSGGVTANVTPAPFAVAVVATGKSVTISGQLAPESGGSASIFTVNSYTDVPEPASIGIFAIAAAGLLGRRRRIAASA